MDPDPYIKYGSGSSCQSEYESARIQIRNTVCRYNVGTYLDDVLFDNLFLPFLLHPPSDFFGVSDRLYLTVVLLHLIGRHVEEAQGQTHLLHLNIGSEQLNIPEF